MTPDEGTSLPADNDRFDAAFAEQPRDDAGRFAPKDGVTAEPAAEPVAEAKLEPQPDPLLQPEAKPEPAKPDTDTIPAWRLKEEADARRAAEERARALEERLSRIPRQPRQPEKPIDLLENPDGYAAALESRISRQLIVRHLNASFEEAHDQHGEAFEKAYASLTRQVESGDDALRDRIANSGNPGRALMRWHQEREAIREIGGDLPGYRKKLLNDEAFRKDALADQAFVDAVLANPEVRKRAMEAWRAEALSPGSSSVTNLPRLSSAPAARAPADTGLGGSDGERFQSVFAR